MPNQNKSEKNKQISKPKTVLIVDILYWNLSAHQASKTIAKK